MRLNSIKKKILGLLTIGLLSFSWVLSAHAANKYETIQIGDDLRQYQLFVPPLYSPDGAYPLVLNFHGTNNNPDKQEALSEFETLAKIEKFIVVTPLALFTRKTDGPITWNVNLKKGPDDVRYIRELLVKLKQTLAIDDKRIFATGFSGGARMSSRLACDLSSTIAAVGPVAGVRFPVDCKPSRGMPVITFHGEKDNVNHFILREDSPEYWSMGVEDALSLWTKNNQCEAPTKTELSSSLKLIEYQACNNKADIVFYRSNEAGHTWPGTPMAKDLLKYGLGKTEEKLNATLLIWKLFKAHPLP